MLCTIVVYCGLDRFHCTSVKYYVMLSTIVVYCGLNRFHCTSVKYYVMLSTIVVYCMTIYKCYNIKQSIVVLQNYV